MKVFSVVYTNGQFEGTALIEAVTADKASTLLQSRGKLNGRRYKCTYIKEIGCNNSSVERILEEYFYDTEDNITLTTGNLNIDSLSKEDIDKLKLKLNKGTGTLYVNRIGALSRIHAEDGYTVLVSYVDKKDTSTKKYHLYVMKDRQYEDLGIPSNYKYIESPSQRLSIGVNKIDGEIVPYIKERISLKKKHYGIFLYKRGSKGKAMHSSDGSSSVLGITKGRFRWTFVKKLDDKYINKVHSRHFIGRLSQALISINGIINLRRNFNSGTLKRRVKYIFAIGELKKSKRKIPTYKVSTDSEGNTIKELISKERRFHMKGVPLVTHKIYK